MSELKKFTMIGYLRSPVFVIINLHMQLDLDHVTWILMFPTVQGTLRVVNHLLVTESWYNTNDFFF